MLIINSCTNLLLFKLHNEKQWIEIDTIKQSIQFKIDKTLSFGVGKAAMCLLCLIKKYQPCRGYSVGALSRQRFNLLQIIYLYFGIFPALWVRSHMT